MINCDKEVILWPRRAPYGARGLKFIDIKGLREEVKSRPVWGAWIEMNRLQGIGLAARVAPRMGRVD